MKPLIPNPCLALITDVAVAGGVQQLVQSVELAVEGGVQMVHLRANHLPTRELADLASKLRTLLDNLGARDKKKALLFVNRRIDIAIDCGADGIHLSQNTLITTEIRRIVEHQSLLLGKSVHGLDSALQAKLDGVDFMIVGPIFQTRSHPGTTPKGVELIRSITRQIPEVPILGIGGIDSSNIRRIMESGAHGAGLIRGLLDHENPREAAWLLRNCLDADSQSANQPVSRG